MTIIAIDDPDDPRVAPYRNIRERDLVGREGLFVAEGEVVLRILVGSSSRFKPVSVLVSAKRLPGLAPLLAQVGAAPVFAADQAVLDRIAGFPLHRGILAIGRVGPALSADALLSRIGPQALVIVAFGIANHDNLGGIFRNAAAFGASGVLLDATCCDPLYRKAIRVSVGTTLTQPFARLPVDGDPLAPLAKAGFEGIAFSPSGARDLMELRRSDRMAVVLGPEGPGLPPEILSRLKTVRISMAAGVDSLNVAVASGIILHHVVSRRA